MPTEWYADSSPEEIVESEVGGGGISTDIQTYQNSVGTNVLALGDIASSNFDGSFTASIPTSTTTLNSATVGKYIYLTDSYVPVTTLTNIESYTPYQIVNRTTVSTAVTIGVFIEEQLFEINGSISDTVVLKNADTVSNGTTGWAISSEGNAIFNSVFVRGTIEATAGLIGGWDIDSSGLYKTAGTTTSWLYPSGLYFESGNYVLNVASGELGTRWFSVDNQSTFETYFEVNDGGIYTVGAITCDNGLAITAGGLSVSGSSFLSGTLEVTNGSHIETSATGTNAAHLQQLNTGQTATVLRLDTARTASLASYHFIRAYSAVGTAPDEEFQVMTNGVTRGDGAYSSPTADYAEFFEWEDGNINSEDRVGYSVALVDNKIKIAESGDIPIGIISATPSVIGDSPWNRWKDKYIKDEFGRELYEPCTIYQWKENKEDIKYFSDRIPPGVIIPEDKEVINTERKVLNPDFDENLEYIPRDERPEWDTVGLLGKIRLRKGQVTAPTWIKLRDISENIEEWLVR